MCRCSLSSLQESCSWPPSSGRDVFLSSLWAGPPCYLAGCTPLPSPATSRQCSCNYSLHRGSKMEIFTLTLNLQEIIVGSRAATWIPECLCPSAVHSPTHTLSLNKGIHPPGVPGTAPLTLCPPITWARPSLWARGHSLLMSCPPSAGILSRYIDRSRMRWLLLVASCWRVKASLFLRGHLSRQGLTHAAQGSQPTVKSVSAKEMTDCMGGTASSTEILLLKCSCSENTHLRGLLEHPRRRDGAPTRVRCGPSCPGRSGSAAPMRRQQEGCLLKQVMEGVRVHTHAHPEGIHVSPTPEPQPLPHTTPTPHMEPPQWCQPLPLPQRGTTSSSPTLHPASPANAPPQVGQFVPRP